QDADHLEHVTGDRRLAGLLRDVVDPQGRRSLRPLLRWIEASEVGAPQSRSAGRCSPRSRPLTCMRQAVDCGADAAHTLTAPAGAFGGCWFSPMRILVVGSGAREHPIVWECLRSPLPERIYVAPANGVTAA